MQRNTGVFARRPQSLAAIRRGAEERLAEAARRAADVYDEVIQRGRDACQNTLEFKQSIDGRINPKGAASVRAIEAAERAELLAHIERSNAEEALVSAIAALDPDINEFRIISATRHYLKPRGLVIGARLYLIVPVEPVGFDPLTHRDESECTDNGHWACCVLAMSLDQVVSIDESPAASS